MKDLTLKRKSKIEVSPSGQSIHSVPMDLSKEYAEVNILRRAYELILENSDTFFTELEKSFMVERENRETNLLI